MKDVKTGIILALLSLVPPVAADDALPLFNDAEPLRAVLTAPLAQTYSQKLQEVRIYYPGQWSYVDSDGNTQRLDVSIRTRGHFRREYCNLPPLQLNFKKSQVKGTLFKGQDKLKLVAPCNHGARYQQYVILEYLAYRVFEVLTDYGYRTRLMRLSYVDGDEKLNPWTDMVFVIEDDADMARRLGKDRIQVPTVQYRQLDQEKMAIVQLFQLLIANNDYSVIRGEEEFCCHNIDVIGDKDSDEGFIPIPFDFDMSGLVNTAYAAPPEQVPVEDVRRRYFYGLCQPDDVLDAAIEHVQSKREEITRLFADSEELDPRNKVKSLQYVDAFYAILDNPNRVQREIVNRCRGRKIMERMLESAADSTATDST